jgi:hypothetical protein
VKNAYLEPVAARQTRFRLHGLAPDARGIAVGRDALVVLESLDRLVALLGAYSEEASLDDLFPSLTLERGAREGGGQAILLRCGAGDGYALDRLSRLAGIARGQLYSGAGSVFVRYRERTAPFGYDLAQPVSELGGVKTSEVLAVDGDFASRYTIVDRIDPVELLQRLSLRQVPIPLGGIPSDPELCGLREMALVLVPPGISERVLSYLWNQEVPMSGVRAVLEGDRQGSLLLRLRHPTGRVLEVLRGITGVELLAPVSPRAAVEIGYRHPIHLASANACLPGDEMYLFRGGVGRVERLEGAPRFVDGRHLVLAEGHTQLREAGGLRQVELEPLRVDLRLRPSSTPREPRASLIAWDQIELLRRLVYVVPPSALAASRVVPLTEGLVIITGSSVGSRSSRAGLGAASIIPLGRRLSEVAPGVLVPDGHELWPRVRPQLIRSLLGLEAEEHALFLTPGADPLRIKPDQLHPLDAAVIGRLELSEPELVSPPIAALGPGRIENERVGRFALWGFRSGE